MNGINTITVNIKNRAKSLRIVVFNSKEAIAYYLRPIFSHSSSSLSTISIEDVGDHGSPQLPVPCCLQYVVLSFNSPLMVSLLPSTCSSFSSMLFSVFLYCVLFQPLQQCIITSVKIPKELVVEYYKKISTLSLSKNIVKNPNNLVISLSMDICYTLTWSPTFPNVSVRYHKFHSYYFGTPTRTKISINFVSKHERNFRQTRHRH